MFGTYTASCSNLDFVEPTLCETLYYLTEPILLTFHSPCGLLLVLNQEYRAREAVVCQHVVYYCLQSPTSLPEPPSSANPRPWPRQLSVWMTTVSIPSISIHVRTVRPLWITAVSTLGNVVRPSGVVCLDESVQEGTAWWTDIGHWTWEIPSASHHNYNQYHCHYDGTVKLLLIPSHRSCHSLTAVVPPNNPLEYCSVQFDHGTRSSCRPIHVLQTRVPCQAYMLSTPLPKSTHGAASNIGVASTPGSVTHTPHVLLLTPCSWWHAK